VQTDFEDWLYIPPTLHKTAGKLIAFRQIALYVLYMFLFNGFPIREISFPEKSIS
jgi:hypothetical protein